MCTVNIKVDDAVLQRICPELTSSESISRWLQNQVNIMLDELVAEEFETMDIETARQLVHETVRKEYALP